MKLGTPVRSFVLLILAGGVLPATAFATSLFDFENRHENAGIWRILPEFSDLSTTSNYDSTGAKAPVSGLTSYGKTQLDLTVVKGITSKFSLFGRLSMASVSFTQTQFTAAGSGLTEQEFGANYRLWNSKNPGGVRQSSIDGQVSLDYPMYDNISLRSETPRQPLLGDGALDFTTAAFGTVPLNQGVGQRLYAVAGAGLTLRGNGYSKAIPYQLQIIGLPSGSGIMYRAGFYGFKSMTSDTSGVTALSPQGQTAPNTPDVEDAGGSLIVDALNSSYLQLRATVGYQWGPGDQAFFTYLVPMSGTSTAVINGFVLGGQFRFGTSSRANNGTMARGATRARAHRKLSYDIQARVTQANDRLNLIKIDKGGSDGIQVGQVIDIYRTGPDGLPKDLVARGVVTSVAASESVVNLRQYKKEVWVQAGFIARRIAPH